MLGGGIKSNKKLNVVYLFIYLFIQDYCMTNTIIKTVDNNALGNQGGPYGAHRDGSPSTW